MSKEEKLVVRSPLRKQLGGFWLLGASFGCYVMWYQGLKGQGSEILLVVAILLALMGLYRCLSFSVTVFQPGNIPLGRQLKCHFGVFKTESSIEFNELEILRRDRMLPYCQLYAYSSLEYLKKKLKPVELEPFEKGEADLPGFVVVDHSTKKECDKLIEKIWRFYDLWDDNSLSENE